MGTPCQPLIQGGHVDNLEYIPIIRFQRQIEGIVLWIKSLNLSPPDEARRISEEVMKLLEPAIEQGNEAINRLVEMRRKHG